MKARYKYDIETQGNILKYQSSHSEVFWKKGALKFTQNPQKNTRKGAHSLAKPQVWSLQPYQKKAPHGHTQALSYFYYVLEFQEHHFPEHLLMVASAVNTVGNLTFHWSKKISGSLKQPVDLRNLITSLITSLFKPLELLLEPYSK